MNAVLKTIEARFEPFGPELLNAVLAVENRAYAFPWSQQNFSDALASGYQAQLLMANQTLLGYFIAMHGAGEVHLLNITVAPEHQRQGWARVMLDALALWSRGQAAHTLWLEVRQSNTRAYEVYCAQGYKRVGMRKAYYPNGSKPHEDAIVMKLGLT